MARATPGVKQESVKAVFAAATHSAGEAKPMHAGQLVREMVHSVLSRQAEARAGRTGEPFGDAPVAVRRTESGRQLEELRLGPHGAERADLWQRGLLSERAKERGRVWRVGRPKLPGLGEHHVDFDEGFLRVQQTLVRSKKRGLSVQEYDAKSESSHRRIPLGRDQLETLRIHRKRRNAEKLIAGSEWKDSGLFFTTRVGTPLNIQSLTYRSYRPILEKAGCPQIRFHDQRHTFAVLALQNGMPPEVLKKTLGHSSIQVTIDYYGHLFPDYQDEVLGRMDDALATLDRAV